MLSQAFLAAPLSVATSKYCYPELYALCTKMTQMFSMGLRLGEREEHGITTMFLSESQFVVYAERCTAGLFC